MWYHVTDENYGAEVLWYPRIPVSAGPRENKTIPRICFAPTLEQCIASSQGTGNNWRHGFDNLTGVWRGPREKLRTIYVYAIHGNCEVVRPTKRQVFDVRVSDEVWRVKPTRLRLVGEISPKLKDGNLQVTWY
jgi:hypothetical protein